MIPFNSINVATQSSVRVSVFVLYCSIHLDQENKAIRLMVSFDYHIIVLYTFSTHKQLKQIIY